MDDDTAQHVGTADESAWLDAEQLTARYRSAATSPVDVIRAVLDRRDRLDPALNAFCDVDPDAARAHAIREARASERRWRRGEPLGPLDGVPVSVKDQLLVRGQAIRRGSRTSDPAPADQDSPAVARLREQGAVPIGKTTTPEFGWKAVTDSPLTGLTRNPWDLARTPGGSSGGAAAAVAAGIGPLALGTDGAGSVRIPAAFCGVAGLKPTFGQVPVYPASAFGVLSHVGPLARTVADVALMMEAIGVPDRRDPWCCPGTAWGTEPGDLRDLGDLGDLRGLRMAFSPRLGLAGVRVDDGIAGTVQAAAGVLERLGAQIEQVDPGFDDPIDVLTTLWCAGAAALLRTIDADRHELIDPGLRAMAEQGERLSGVDVAAAMNERTRLGALMARFHERHPVLITPTLPITAFEVGADGADVPPGWPSPAWTSWTPFTYPFNLTQQPALTVPCGFSQGLPVGLHLVADRFADPLLLRVGHAFQLATDWHLRRPPLA